MLQNRVIVAAALVSAIAVACSGEDTSSSDAGTDAQVATDTGAVDSGSPDTTTVVDSGPQVSTSCSAFPATVTLGGSVAMNTSGAALCNDGGTTCRLTTNTFSDGPEPCANNDVMLVFLSAAGAYGVNTGPKWTFETTSAGTLVFANKSIKDIPASTPVTATVTDGTSKKKVVFQFNGGSSFTITSVGT